MAWEQRHGRLFYYLKVREGKRIRSVYMGNGYDAELCSRTVQDNHHRKQKAQLNRASEDTFQQHMDALDREVTTITKEALITAGFHQHKGSWRKKRH